MNFMSIGGCRVGYPFTFIRQTRQLTTVMFLPIYSVKVIRLSVPFKTILTRFDYHYRYTEEN